MHRTRVLYATDGSSGAEQALELLIGCFEPSGVETVEVISVVARVARGLGSRPEEAGAPETIIDAAHSEAAQRIVRDASQRLQEAGFQTVETVRAGHPAETIVTHASVRRPDLVLLGTRGLSGLSRQLVGSVSGKVARYAPASVLVARTPGPIRRVVLGYDASPDADLALDGVGSLPLRQGISVTVCTAYEVVAPLRSGIAPTMFAQVDAARREDLRLARKAADAIAADATRRLVERGVDATPRVSHGSPHEQLAILASELAADLLVVGSRGLSGIQRFFLGSTSATLVAHPPTSVLVARRNPDA